MSRRSIVLGLVLIAIVSSATRARAGGDAFAAYVASLSGGKPTAHLGRCTVLVTPDGRIHRPCAMTVADLVGAASGVTLTVTRSTSAQMPNSQFSEREAVVVARAGKKVIATFDVVEIVGDFGPDDVGDAPVAVMWARQITDKAALAAAKTGTLPTPPAIADYRPAAPADDKWTQDLGDAQNGYDWVHTSAAGMSPADLADEIKDGAVVLGSAPGQRYVGKRGAKTVGGWKMTFEQQGGRDLSGEAWVSIAVTHMIGTVPGKSPVTIPYVTMIVNTQFLSGGGAPAPRTSLVKFAIAQ
ncbi:MAG: hypothetical protein K8W52_20500 [Deltaproteobacteria bacterium]|nr:hypothetical protein [Deltaproteobacteria bacterium]